MLRERPGYVVIFSGRNRGKIAQERLGHASISTTLNIYMMSWMPRTARPSKNSKSASLARWTVLD